MTVGAADTGEALGKVTTPEVVMYHMGDYRTEKTMADRTILQMDQAKPYFSIAFVVESTMRQH